MTVPLFIEYRDFTFRGKVEDASENEDVDVEVYAAVFDEDGNAAPREKLSIS